MIAAVAALLLTAPGSQARSDRSQQLHQRGSWANRHPGFRRGVASWYYDDHRPTACGFHVKFGVANRKLPCGKHVTFLHAGHRVTAVVDDRGPYVTGLTWDLDEHTAAALHVSGIATVWTKSP